MNPKINESNESLDAQYLLNERLKSSIKTLSEVETLLKVIEANLKHSNEYNDALIQENWQLKLSCEKWMKRAIQLEFKVLSALDR
jgi:hypothetical protein